MRSKFTLEPYQTPEEIYKEMVQLFIESRGYGDLHEAYKVLLPIDPAKIGIELFTVIEDMNEKLMLENGYCPEDGDALINIHIPATRESQSEDYARCPTCHDRHRRAC